MPFSLSSLLPSNYAFHRPWEDFKGGDRHLFSHAKVAAWFVPVKQRALPAHLAAFASANTRRANTQPIIVVAPSYPPVAHTHPDEERHRWEETIQVAQYSAALDTSQDGPWRPNFPQQTYPSQLVHPNPASSSSLKPSLLMPNFSVLYEQQKRQQPLRQATPMLTSSNPTALPSPSSTTSLIRRNTRTGNAPQATPSHPPTDLGIRLRSYPKLSALVLSWPQLEHALTPLVNWLHSLPDTRDVDRALSEIEADKMFPDRLMMEWLSDDTLVDGAVQALADEGLRRLKAIAPDRYARYIHPVARVATTSTDAITTTNLARDFAPEAYEIGAFVARAVRDRIAGVNPCDVTGKPANKKDWLNRVTGEMTRRYLLDDVCNAMEQKLKLEYAQANPTGAFGRSENTYDLRTNERL